MTESLRRLLQHPIDYAGLFPPTNQDMRTALADYGRVMDSRDEWIINRFLCPADRLSDCFETLGEFEDKSSGKAPWIDFGVIGTALTSGATAADSLKKDVSEIKLAFQHGDVIGAGLEGHAEKFRDFQLLFRDGQTAPDTGGRDLRVIDEQGDVCPQLSFRANGRLSEGKHVAIAQIDKPQ